MTFSNDWEDVLERLKNKNSDTYSDGQLIVMAILEIERLRESVANLERRNQELSSKIVEYMLIRERVNKHE
jgi:hypothetical protein